MLSKIDANIPLNIIIHTNGGESDSADTIAVLLKERKGIVNIYIPKYAYSAGTMIALGGDYIYMNWYSVGGPIDAQLDFDHDNELGNDYSTRHIRKLVKCKEKEDRQFLQGCLADDFHNECEIILRKLLQDNDNVEIIIENLLNNNISHGYSYTRSDFEKFGLPIKYDVPDDIMKIFNLYKNIFI